MGTWQQSNLHPSRVICIISNVIYVLLKKSIQVIRTSIIFKLKTRERDEPMHAKAIVFFWSIAFKSTNLFSVC